MLGILITKYIPQSKRKVENGEDRKTDDEQRKRKNKNDGICERKRKRTREKNAESQ